MARTPSNMISLGSEAPDFNLRAVNSETDICLKEYKGKLGLAKAISLVTSRPILYITIYRINLEEIREDQPFYDQYKEFKDFSKKKVFTKFGLCSWTKSNK